MSSILQAILDYLKAITYGTQILAALVSDSGEADKIAAQAIVDALATAYDDPKAVACVGLHRLISAVARTEVKGA